MLLLLQLHRTVVYLLVSHEFPYEENMLYKTIYPLSVAQTLLLSGRYLLSSSRRQVRIVEYTYIPDPARNRLISPVACNPAHSRNPPPNCSLFLPGKYPVRCSYTVERIPVIVCEQSWQQAVRYLHLYAQQDAATGNITRPAHP